MARGTETSSKTYFKINYENKDKDGGKPFFSEQKKVGENWEGISKDTFLEGFITGVSQDSYEYRGKPQNTFELTINGGDETYNLQLNFGYFTRSILNSLAGVSDLGKSKIRLEIYRNQQGFVNVAVKDTTTDPKGVRTDWAIPNMDLPKKETEKWLPSFTHFIGVIKGKIPENSEVNHSQEEEETDPMAMEAEFAKQKENKDDDLPF